MKLNLDVAPVVRSPRKFPHAIKDKIRESLDEIEENDNRKSKCAHRMGFLYGRSKKEEHRRIKNMHWPSWLIYGADETQSSTENPRWSSIFDPRCHSFFSSRYQKCILAHHAWWAIKLLHDVQLSAWRISLSTYAIRHFFQVLRCISKLSDSSWKVPLANL